LQPLFLALKSGLAQLNEFWVDPMIQRKEGKTCIPNHV